MQAHVLCQTVRDETSVRLGILQAGLKQPMCTKAFLLINCLQSWFYVELLSPNLEQYSFRA